MWPAVPLQAHRHCLSTHRLSNSTPSSAFAKPLPHYSYICDSHLLHQTCIFRTYSPQHSSHRAFSRSAKSHTFRPSRAAADGLQGAPQPHALPRSKQSDVLSSVQKAGRRQLRKLDGLWGRFIPMCTLFFMMAFINTILDSLANSLVITAVGGGTEVIPFLTVYGVLPISCIFLVLYSYATQRFSRATLFNIVVSTFLALYSGFALLYPHHETMHLHGFATQMLESSPAGLAGAIGMVRNWMFTLFYCTSELWGDVVLSLLFWGLANETTSLRDAPLLYPLFGVGANVAQTLAGRILSAFSKTTASKLSYAQQVQSCMVMVLCLGLGILAMHHYINVRFPHNYGVTPVPVASMSTRLTPLTTPALPQESNSNGASTSSSSSSNGASIASSTSSDETSSSAELHGNGRPEVSTSEAGRFQASLGVSSNSSSDASSSTTAHSPSTHHRHNRQGNRSKLGFKEAVVFLAKSPQIRCLAMMALAQGLTTNLLDVAWKQHLHMMHPSPAAYSAFMGEVAMWTGLVTGTLMFVSPILFDRLGWRGVAGATPLFMLWAGMPFFAGVVLYTLLPSTASATLAPSMLRFLVITGAIIQVFAKGAKFSMFKPAEEMVYIGLDEESRTKGKAAIDVVGAQSGKSAGSVLQQFLLVVSGGASLGRLPVMALAFFFMLRSWLESVRKLATFSNCSMTHVESTVDEDDEDNNDRWPPTDVANTGLQAVPVLGKR